jgi:hypothetical protein
MNIITTKIVSEMIGIKGQQSSAFMGNHAKSLRFGLPTNDSNDEFIASMEFIRYAVIRELFQFVCLVSTAFTIDPEKISDLSNDEIDLLVKNPELIKTHQLAVECVVFTMETKDHLYVKTYKICRGFMGIITNLVCCGKSSFYKLKDSIPPESGIVRDFFSGMKTTIANDELAIEYFSSKLNNLKNAAY